MVQSFAVLSAAFVQLALLARVSTAVPIPSGDMPSDSQVLSKRTESQIYKRTPLDTKLLAIAGGVYLGTLGTGIAVVAALTNRKPKSSAAATAGPQGTGQGSTTPDLEAGRLPPQTESYELQDRPGSVHRSKRSELPYNVEVEERGNVKARGYYIDELD